MSPQNEAPDPVDAYMRETLKALKDEGLIREVSGDEAAVEMAAEVLRLSNELRQQLDRGDLLDKVIYAIAHRHPFNGEIVLTHDSIVNAPECIEFQEELLPETREHRFRPIAHVCGSNMHGHSPN